MAPGVRCSASFATGEELVDLRRFDRGLTVDAQQVDGTVRFDSTNVVGERERSEVASGYPNQHRVRQGELLHDLELDSFGERSERVDLVRENRVVATTLGLLLPRRPTSKRTLRGRSSRLGSPGGLACCPQF